MKINLEKDFKNFPSDPKKRINKYLAKLIQNKDIIFDVHCHFFNKENVPNKLLGFKIPFTKKFFDKLEKIFANLYKKTSIDSFTNIEKFIDIFNTPDDKLYTDFFAYYFDNIKNPNTIFCPLMMDMTSSVKGSVEESFTKQMNEMVYLQKKYPSFIMPFVAINPNNPNALKNFRDAFIKYDSFFGVKLYPSLGYLPSHPILMEIYKICEEKNIPITTHCGGGTVHNSRHYIRNIRGKKIFNNKIINIPEKEQSKFFFSPKNYGDFFNDPKNFETVLLTYPKLKLNFAHFGSVDEWKKVLNNDKSTWVSTIMNFMSRFENVYADVSYNISDMETYKILKDKITNNKLIRDRVLFGSDYYMVCMEGNFADIKINFITSMGDNVMNQISKINPRKFLFE